MDKLSGCLNAEGFSEASLVLLKKILPKCIYQGHQCGAHLGAGVYRVGVVAGCGRQHSFDNYGASWSEDVKGVASSFLCTGMFFLLFSVINSVLVLLAVNEMENDHQATRLLQRLDLWFTIPSIYFYLGVACGAFGFLIWFPAAFPLKYALFNITAGFAIIALNAPYYQFLILCVYDTRVEANLRIPSHPTWLRRLPLFKCLRQKTKDDALPAKPTEECSCVTPIATNDDELSAIKLLEAALDSIGQSSLLPLFVDSGWDDLDALAGLQEHHVAQITKLKPGHIARFRRCLRRQLEGRVDAKKAS